MKIAVLSDDGITVAQHGGRAAGCVVFDTDDRSGVDGEFRPFAGSGCHDEKPGQEHTAEHVQGQNHQGILNLVGGCQVVISGGMGRRLREDLQHLGMRALTTDEQDAQRASKLYAAGLLAPSAECDCGRH